MEVPALVRESVPGGAVKWMGGGGAGDGSESGRDQSTRHWGVPPGWLQFAVAAWPLSPGGNKVVGGRLGTGGAAWSERAGPPSRGVREGAVAGTVVAVCAGAQVEAMVAAAAVEGPQR